MSWSSLLLLFCHVSTLTHIYRHFKYEIPSEWCRHHGAVCLVPLGCQLPNVRPCSIKQRIQPIFDLSRVYSFEAAKQILLLLTLQARGKECWKQLAALRFVTVHGRSNMVQPYTRFIQYRLCILIPVRSNQGARKQQPAERKLAQRAIRVLLSYEKRSNKLSSEENRWSMLKKLISSWALQKSALEDHCDKSCSVKWVATQGSCMFSNAYSLPTISCSQSILPCDANDPHVRREPSSLVLLLKLCLETFD